MAGCECLYTTGKVESLLFSPTGLLSSTGHHHEKRLSINGKSLQLRNLYVRRDAMNRVLDARSFVIGLPFPVKMYIKLTEDTARLQIQLLVTEVISNAVRTK